MSSRKAPRSVRKSKGRTRQTSSASLSGPAVSGGLNQGLLIRRQSVPLSLKARLGYNEQFTAAPASGSSDGYVINLQSLYDPRLAAGGHQPQYFDQLMAIWTYFVVRSVTIRLTVIADHDVMTSGTGSSTSVYQGAAIIAPFRNTSGTRPSAAASDMLEWQNSITAPYSSVKGATLLLKIDIPRLVGIKWAFLRNNPAYWGTNGGNPSTMNAYAFVGAIAQGAGQPSPALCQATVSYDVEVFQPQTLATS